MPPNRVLKDKFKSHMGRTFTLRKVGVLPGYGTGKACADDPGRILNRVDDLGEAVFVLDETNTRVCVVMQGGHSIWIQKYYLHKELPSAMRKRQDTASHIIGKAMAASKSLRGSFGQPLTTPISSKEREMLIALLEEIAITLRSLTDDPHQEE